MSRIKIDIPHFYCLTYQEGKKKMEVDIDFREKEIILEKALIRRWQAPYENEKIPDAAKEKILREIYSYLVKTCGFSNVVLKEDPKTDTQNTKYVQYTYLSRYSPELLAKAYVDIRWNENVGEITLPNNESFEIELHLPKDQCKDFIRELLSILHLIDFFVQKGVSEFDISFIEFFDDRVVIEYVGNRVNTAFDVRIHKKADNWYCTKMGGRQEYIPPVCLVSMEDKIKSLSSEKLVTLKLCLAEESAQVISAGERKEVMEAIQFSRQWEQGNPGYADTLWNYMEADIDKGFMFKPQNCRDQSEKAAWQCIAAAIAYVCYNAYLVEGVESYPQSLELFDAPRDIYNPIGDTIKFAQECGAFTRQEINDLIVKLSSEYPRGIVIEPTDSLQRKESHRVIIEKADIYEKQQEKYMLSQLDRIKELSGKIGKIGFCTEKGSDQNMNYVKILSARVPSKEEMSFLLNEVSDKMHICFFDFFHRQITDPGAYITAVHTKDGYQYKMGNHGWQSEWKHISADELSAYIIKNWQHGDPYGKYKNYIEIDDYQYGFPSNNLL